MIERKAVLQAFKALRKEGFIARANFMCCMSCACAEIATKVAAKGGDPGKTSYVFWHKQDEEYAFPKRWGRKSGSLYLRWGGDPARIVEALIAQGLVVYHDGKASSCVEVLDSITPL
jgi:hypothetical protein